jgi:hypothetical protein
MSQVIPFTPKRELSAQKNLKEFIALGRDHLVLWSDLPGFAWDADNWPTTHRGVRFINFENRSMGSRTPPKPGQLMHKGFAEFAKACLRYRHTLRSHKAISTEISALRVMEYALRNDMAVPDITKFDQRHWEVAVSALEPFSGRQGTCSRMLEVLKMLANICILRADPHFWRHPYVGQQGYDMANGTRASDEAKAKKVPDQDALLSIAEVFSRGASETLEDSDVMVTCVTGILLSAPMRIGESLRFRTDCLRPDYDKNGELQHYLAYWVPKIRQFTRKAIPKTMIEVATESIKRLTAITEEGRALARYLESTSHKFYRHANCPNVPDDQELTPAQVAQALGSDSIKGCSNFIKRHTGSYMLTGFTLNTLWQLVLTENRTLNPHFPYQESKESSTEQPLKMSESLMCFRRHQLSTRKPTSPVILLSFVSSYYGQRLTVGSKKAESMNFFARNGYETIKFKSHSLRHFLNRLGRSSGMPVTLLTDWSSRANTRQTSTYLHDDPAKAAAKGAVILGTTQEQEPQKPVTSDEADLYGQGPYHRSRYGICRRTWRMGPCNKFADCLNCSELLMCKGDKFAAEIIRQDRNNLMQTYKAAQQAIENGERAASRWTEKAAPQIDRLDELLAILNNPSIPDGSPIEIAGEDFSHENIIITDKAEKSGVRLLDKNELGITYGDELLACLELLRNSDNV